MARAHNRAHVEHDSVIVNLDGVDFAKDGEHSLGIAIAQKIKIASARVELDDLPDSRAMPAERAISARVALLMPQAEFLSLSIP